MKICILSDSHDNHAYMASAMQSAKDAGAEAILHCGDVVAAKTLKSVLGFGIPIHVIHGNNLGDNHAMMRVASKSGGLLQYHGMDASLELAGKRVFLVHYPHYAQAMATTGDWDLVCCGHSHQARIAQIPTVQGNQCLLINPGTVGGLDAPATFVLGDLASMQFEIVDQTKP